MADGKIDVVLEDWQNIAGSTRSTSRAGQLVNLGSNGVIGLIGWFIPTYL